MKMDREAAGFAEVTGDAVERNIAEGGLGAAMQKDAIFAAEADIAEDDAGDGADGAIGVARQGGYVNGLGITPPFGVKLAGFNDAVTEENIAHIAGIAQLDGEAAMGLAHNTSGDDDIGDVADGFGADFYGCGRTDDGATGNRDIFGRAVLGKFAGGFDDDAIVTGFNMAIADSNIAAVIGVNAVAVGNVETVKNGDAVNNDIGATGEVTSPLGGITNGDIHNPNLVAPEKADDARAKVFWFADVGAIVDPPAIHESEGLAINGAETGDGDAIGGVGIDEECAGIAAVFSAHEHGMVIGFAV